MEEREFLQYICMQFARGPSGVRNRWNALLKGTYFTGLFITEFKIEVAVVLCVGLFSLDFFYKVRFM